MPRQKTTMSELRVGLLVVASVTILVIFILSVSGGLPFFQHNATYVTKFAAADGLKKGDEVRLAGKNVGKVDSVEFGAVPTSKDEKPIVVVMTVDGWERRWNVSLPEGSSGESNVVRTVRREG